MTADSKLDPDQFAAIAAAFAGAGLEPTQFSLPGAGCLTRAGEALLQHTDCADVAS